MTYCLICGLQSFRQYCPTCVENHESITHDTPNPLHDGVSEAQAAAEPPELLLVCPVCSNSVESNGGRGFYVLENTIGNEPQHIFDGDANLVLLELRVCRVCRYVFFFDRFGQAAAQVDEPVGPPSEE